MTTPATKEDFEKKLLEFGRDVLTVDVLTLTGNLDIKISEIRKNPQQGQQATDDAPIDFEKVFSKLKGDASGKLQVVGYSHVGLDKDTIQYVMQASDPDHPLIKHHRETVKDVQAARKAFLDSVINLLT